MAKGGQGALTVRVEIEGAEETLRAFRRLPKDASAALRDRSMELAQTLAVKVAGAGNTDTPQSALVAVTVRARRDRIPVIVAGGAKRVGSRRKPAFKILFGSEFGSNHLPQFRPHQGKHSYWFFDEVYRSQSEIAAAWGKAADDVVRSFSRET